MNNYKSFRWLILCLGIVANLSQGISYSGSVISNPLLLNVGVPETELKAHWAMVFSLSIAFLPLGMIIAGWLADKKGPRLPIALGAVTFASGAILASFATSYTFLCFTFGFLLSVGSGLAYGPIVASAVRWFPDRRGLASGLVVGALGFGPVLIAPFCSVMLNTYHFDITIVLRCLGIASLVAIGTASFITSPPSDFQSPTAKSDAAKKPAAADVSWRQMITTVNFWVLFLFFFLGAMPGLMLLSAAKGIFESLGGFTPEKAALLVAVLAAGNAAGRVLWGTISDYLGRINTLTIMFICSAVAMFTLPFAANPILLVAVILMIGTTFGGYLGLFPSFCADSFGLKNNVSQLCCLVHCLCHIRFCRTSHLRLVGTAAGIFYRRFTRLTGRYRNGDIQESKAIVVLNGGVIQSQLPLFFRSCFFCEFFSLSSKRRRIEPFVGLVGIRFFGI